MRVAIAERDRLGGECNHYGCVPTKVMLRSAKIAALARDAGRFGVRIPSVTVDLPAVQQRARDVIEAQSGEGAAPFERAGIRVFMQEARLIGPASDRARGRDAGRGRPRRAHHRHRGHGPADRGLEDGPFWTNKEAIWGPTEPPRVARGHRSGSDRGRVRADLLAVRDAGHGPRGTPPHPPRRGRGGGRRARARAGGGGDRAPYGRDDRTARVTRPTDGRSSSRGARSCAPTSSWWRPVVGRCSTDTISRRRASSSTTVAGRSCRRRSAPRARTSGRRETPRASCCSRTSAATRPRSWSDDILGRPRARDYRVVPKVTFCDPEVASVGLTEREARDQGHEVRTAVSSLADNERAHIEGSATRPGEARGRRSDGRDAGRAHRGRRGRRDDPRDRRRDGRASLGVRTPAPRSTRTPRSRSR